MTISTDLADFLLACIAEDKRLALAAAGDSPEWVAGSEETCDGENVYYTVTAKAGTTWEPDYFLTVYGGDRRDAARDAHIARHDPARVLADCEAKRRVVGLARHIADSAWQDGALIAVSESRADRMLRFLALPYADHPDYRVEWRP